MLIHCMGANKEAPYILGKVVVSSMLGRREYVQVEMRMPVARGFPSKT